MRVRSWCAASALGVVTGFVAVALPLVPRPPAPTIPATPVERAALSTASETVHPGWVETADGAANLVSVSWSGDPTASFAIETRDEHGRWSVAGTVASEQADEGPDPGTAEYARATRERVSRPLWVGHAAAVRVRLAEGSARGVTLQRVRTPPATPSPGVAGASMQPFPRIISRVDWGANENLRLANCPEGPTYADNVKLAVVHHTGGSNSYGPGDTPAIVRVLYAYATQTLHYCDTHYNFFVDRYGQIFEGRFGGVDRPVLAAHATGINWNTVGIALIGNFQDVPPPPAAVEALEYLLAWKLAWHGVDPTRNVDYRTAGGTDRWPAGTTKSLPAIIGHRDPGATDCPGTYLYAQLPAIRAEVARRVVTGATDRLQPWTAQTGRPKLLLASAYGPLYPAGGEPAVASPGAWPGWPIVRDMEVRLAGGGYELDGWGGLHEFGGAPAVASGGYWRGWDIARDLLLRPGGGGWVLDGWGGIHEFGGAPPIVGGPYWRGFDIARRLVALSTGVYVLDGWGGIHPIGGAPPISGPYWPGWDIARDLRPAPSGPGGYLLDGFGDVVGVGGAPPVGGAPYFGRDVARSIVLLPGGGGYTMEDSGKLTPFGGAPAVRQGRATFAGAGAITAPYVMRSLALAP